MSVYFHRAGLSEHSAYASSAQRVGGYGDAEDEPGLEALATAILTDKSRGLLHILDMHIIVKTKLN